MRAPREIEPIKQPFVRLQGAGERLHAGSRDLDMALRSTASLWSRVAHARHDQAFGLEALERGVQRTRCDRPSRTICQFRANRYTVRIPTESQNRKEDQLLEFTEIQRSSHLNCIVVQIDELSSCVYSDRAEVKAWSLTFASWNQIGKWLRRVDAITTIGLKKNWAPTQR